MGIRQKSLSELAAAIHGAVIVGASDAVVSGIAFDSRRVEPGFLFIAVPGAKSDGHAFVRAVVAAGAAAVVIQSGRESEFSDLSVPLLIVPDSRRAMPHLACAFYDNPTAKLHLVGVTGTNGKTTTALMMESIARAAGDTTCYVGTLGFGMEGAIVEGDRTTPESIDLQAFFADCVDRGVTAAAIEVASHALALGRTDGCLFDVGVFTNLTLDHLDFHLTMDAYRDAKGILFGEYASASVKSGKKYHAVINDTDKATSGRYQALLDLALLQRDYEPLLTFTPRPAEGESAAIYPVDVELFVDRIRYTAKTPIGDVPVALGFGGTFNVENSLAAVGYGVARGLFPEVIARGLATCAPVPGRFQPVAAGQDFAVLVDYAHTPDGLENVLRSARPLTKGRLISVFGCGGDRETTKRAIMGRLSVELADISIATSDNPRTEDPDAILAEIRSGMDPLGVETYFEVDRRKAIQLAVSMARPGDTIVLAGKGHENYQIIGTVKHPFDDTEVAREAITQCSVH